MWSIPSPALDHPVCGERWQNYGKRLWLRHLCLSVSLSVRMERPRAHWTVFHEILCLSILLNLWRKFKFHEHLTKITGIVQEDQSTF